MTSMAEFFGFTTCVAASIKSSGLNVVLRVP